MFDGKPVIDVQFLLPYFLFLDQLSCMKPFGRRYHLLILNIFTFVYILSFLP
jgi:hypothetical protein